MLKESHKETLWYEIKNYQYFDVILIEDSRRIIKNPFKIV